MLESIDVLAPGSNYDVINPPITKITDNVGTDRYYTDKKDSVIKDYKHIIKIEKGKEVSRKSELLSEDFYKAKPNPYKKNKK